MALSIGSMITIGLRLFQYRADIERLAPQIAAVMDSAMKLAPQVSAILNDATRLAPEVQRLAQTIAPELFGTPQITQTYDVRWLQTGLKTLGYDPGPIDGIMGPRTTAAIKQFQADNGLVPDGWAGIATEAKLDELLRAA